MIQITPQMRSLLAVNPVDFRKGIDGLAGTCKLLELDAFSGYLFVFRNRSGTSIKVITYNGQGFWCCQKRLSKGGSASGPKEERSRVAPLTSFRPFSGTKTRGRRPYGDL